eukprot:GHVU01202858.1.p3 GENE.GHVU01202858.1~~GHVU01202858.1.p3  ORF type:complete len:107 (+),score=10.53 GHVU01202858.1:579-899(+)
MGIFTILTRSLTQREYIPLLHTEIVEDRASLCALHVAKRNYDEANEGYQSIQRAHPDAAALTVYYAMVLFLKEDYSKALEVAQVKQTPSMHPIVELQNDGLTAWPE